LRKLRGRRPRPLARGACAVRPLPGRSRPRRPRGSRLALPAAGAQSRPPLRAPERTVRRHLPGRVPGSHQGDRSLRSQPRRIVLELRDTDDPRRDQALLPRPLLDRPHAPGAQGPVPAGGAQPQRALERTWPPTKRRRARARLRPRGRAGARETLTLTRLGIRGRLRKTLESTNPRESMIECVRRTSRNVKHWQSGDMCLRWTAAGMLEAEHSHSGPRSGRGTATAAAPLRSGWTRRTVRRRGTDPAVSGDEDRTRPRCSRPLKMKRHHGIGRRWPNLLQRGCVPRRLPPRAARRRRARPGDPGALYRRPVGLKATPSRRGASVTPRVAVRPNGVPGTT
jgi:hypothetical protein